MNLYGDIDFHINHVYVVENPYQMFWNIWSNFFPENLSWHEICWNTMFRRFFSVFFPKCLCFIDEKGMPSTPHLFNRTRLFKLGVSESIGWHCWWRTFTCTRLLPIGVFYRRICIFWRCRTSALYWSTSSMNYW